MTTIHDPSSPVAREVLSNERLLWQGRPGQGIRFSPADVMMIPFSLLWGGFAFFWEFGVLTDLCFDITNPFAALPVSFFALWGIPFCLVGLYMIIGRFFYDAFVRAGTFYGVTDQRALVVRGGSVTALNLASLDQVNIRESRSGKGTLTFGPDNAFMPTGMGRGRGQAPVVAFVGIAEVRRVYRLIEEARAALRSGSRF
ncbi:hypothetical protein ABI_14520 [Asticcacaulis biprosthecium C19]|uniref:DUF304 domain-containing protein n=1 Tax=Asticcacaulis biprosthecium C19 TaxID=715226 RepID=F4QIV0_9CAUL|nr:hypothetical protein [Asticcacaulis biprosthecium]EGF93013.1 hypothetical protein ABI_14520 [Asticcacaulis biprosthecium C19]